MIKKSLLLGVFAIAIGYNFNQGLTQSTLPVTRPVATQMAEGVSLQTQDIDDAVHYLGDPIELPVFLRNETDKDISVIDYRSDARTGSVLSIRFVVKEGGSSSFVGYGPGQLSQKDMLLLQAHKVGPLATLAGGFCVPGKYEVSVIYGGDEWRFASGEQAPDNFRAVELTARVKVKVSSEMSSKMKERYDRIDKTLADPTVKIADKCQAINTIAAEKHYFAARQIAGIWKNATDDALKECATDRILDLLEFGVAYESLWDVVEMLKDDSVAIDRRVRLIEILSGFVRRDSMSIHMPFNIYAIRDSDVGRISELLTIASASGNTKLAAAAEGLQAKLAAIGKKSAQAGDNSIQAESQPTSRPKLDGGQNDKK